MYECAMLRESGEWAVRQGEGPAGLDERAPEKVITVVVPIQMRLYIVW